MENLCTLNCTHLLRYTQNSPKKGPGTVPLSSHYDFSEGGTAMAMQVVECALSLLYTIIRQCVMATSVLWYVGLV